MREPGTGVRLSSEGRSGWKWSMQIRVPPGPAAQLISSKENGWPVGPNQGMRIDEPVYQGFALRSDN
jgi:hypothetical protein